MRVLMLSWEYPPHFVGGLCRHVTELATALAAEGVRLQIVTPQLAGGAENERAATNLAISRVPPGPTDRTNFITFVESVNAALEARARALAQQHGPFDLIHAHDWLVAHAGVALKYAWQRPLVGTIHSTEWGRTRGLIQNPQQRAIDGVERWLAHESWRIITVSNFMSNQLKQIFGLDHDQVQVVYNAVRPLAQPLSASEKQTTRRRYAADHERVIFTVGRLVYEKGFQTLIEAIPNVLAAEPNTRLIIAGTGDLREFLELRARELGVAERVHFTDFISDEERDRLYQVADVAVFPSLYEPFGIVALEAMAACCPVVVSGTGGLQEVVQLHETGITVFPDNPESLAWGILHTLQQPEWAAQRTENAKRMIEQQFTWQIVAQRTIEIYKQISEEWREGRRSQNLAPPAAGRP